MNLLLALIPEQYRVLAEVLATLAIVGAVWGWIEYGKHEAREGGLKDGRSEVQAKWDADTKTRQAQAIADAETNAKETKRRLERQGDAQREQATELARYQRVSADAVAARDSLQLDVDNLTAVARRAFSDSATAGERQAGAAAAGMLSDLSRGADAMAEFYAREADAGRRAGVLCERSYDALINPTRSP